jgi:HEAT repeat protein
VIEAAGLVSQADVEELFCQGLNTPWATTRYAATMALASKASKNVLQPTTLAILRTHQDKCEALPVRLTSAYALLSSGDSSGMEVLIEFLNPHAHEEARKAATFILATEISIPLSASLRERLMHDLLLLLRDLNNEIALLAARALRHIAQPSALPAIRDILEQDDPEMQIRALTALEEIIECLSMRRTTQQQAFPALIAPLLRSERIEVRRQASYTLAAIGGEYTLAVLGTTTLNDEHPGHIEAIEGLRLLYNALRHPTREIVIRWLLHTLQKGEEKSQVTALDSLTYLLWQARTRGQKRIWQKMSHTVMDNGIIVALLYANSTWVRQRTVELVGMLAEHETITPLVRRCMLSLLHTDSDSAVRACVAATCGQTSARWAIPDLIQALLDEDEQVTITALNALGQLATHDHRIVFHVVQELARHGAGQPQSTIQQEAQTLLKKWRKIGKAKRKQLQTSS